MIMPDSRRNSGEERKEKILIGESDPFLRNLLVECLEEEYEVAAVDNGDDLERELRKSTYDLVLREVILPRKNQANIVCALQQMVGDAPCIFMVNGGLDDSPASGGYPFELAAPQILPKPFGLDALFGQINRVLGKASATGACAIGRSA